MTRRYSFFATRSDLISLLEKVECQRQIYYVRIGLFDSAMLQYAVNARCIEQLGVALAGDQNQVPSYLIVDAKTEVDVEKIPQRRGGVKYVVDQLQNSKSIVLKPGGEFENIAIIAGEFGTVSRDGDSLSLLSLVSKQLRKDFKNIKGWYVGREAIKAMNLGVRLTANINSPPVNDLRIDTNE